MITHWRSYLIWAGGSNKIGVLGYVNAAFELKSQIKEGLIPEPDYIFTTMGSSGTTAGLLLGCELAGLKSKIFGIAVTSEQWASRKLVLKLARKCLKYMRKFDANLPDISLSILDSRLEINQDYWGGQYGIVTDKGQHAMELIKKTDNIKLETTYTGKTLSALLDYIEIYKDSLQNKTILFINSYSSVDQSDKVKKMDYHNLDEKLHRYFDGSIRLSEKIVNIDGEI
jgi:D-cysteine desulfhydrase